MRIVTRLRIISTATAVALAVLAPVLIWSFIEFKSAKNDYALAGAIKVNFFERASFRDQYFLYRETRALGLWDKNKEISDRLLRQAEVQFRDKEDRQVLERLRRNIEDTAIIFHRIANNTEALNTASGNRQVYDELDKRLYSQLLLKAAAVRDTVATLEDASARRAEQTYRRLATIIGLFAVTLALTTILASMYLGRLIRRRLAPLHDGAKIVADGDLDYRIKCEGADEFAELALSINAMTDKLAAEISTHTHLEIALRDSDERLHMALSGAGMAIWDWHIPSGALVFSARWAEIQGYTPEELPARVESWETRVFPDDMPQVRDKLERHFKGETPIYESEHRARHKDGHWVWVQSRGKVVERDDAGNPVRAMGIALDITERKQAEGKLRTLSTAIEQSPLSVVITDLDANIQYVNPCFIKTTGYSMEEAIGQNPRILQSGQTPKETYAELWKTLTGGQIWRGELVNKRKNGEWYWEEAHIAPVMDLAGAPMLYVAVKLEITERKKFEEELKRSNAELEQFGYAVSHDMRQPLRMISSYLQLLEMSLAGQLDGEKRDYFNFAIEGAKRIDQMLVALLEYSRVGRMGDQPAWVESRTVLDEALQFLQPAITEAQARVNISGEWPRILASRDEVLRLLQNLIGNAAKFRVAGRTPEIIVSSEVIKNEWHLCVADNGVGIIPDQIKRLFQVFQRLQSRAAYEGTGIGLALCRKIAEHHKGRIWAESEGEGLGSKFCVVLPVLRGET